MTIKTVLQKIRESDERSKIISTGGLQGYQDSIDNLKEIQNLCKWAVVLLEKCRKKDIPFQEYEIMLRKNAKDESA